MRNIRIIIVLLVTAVTVPAAARAQAPPMGPQLPISQEPFQQFAPAVGFDSANNFVAVWVSRDRDGSGDGIFGRRFDSAGEGRGAEFQVNTSTAGDQTGADLAVDPSGSFVVVWQKDGTTESAILARRYGSAGNPIGSEIEVAFAGITPRVAIDAAGALVVVWAVHANPMGNAGLDVYARRYDANGVPQGAGFLVNTATDFDQFQPSVAMSPSGAFVVSWADLNFSIPHFRIFARSYDGSGKSRGSQFPVDTDSPLDQGNPDVAAGDFVVVWATDTIVGQRFDDVGNPQGPRFPISTQTVAFEPSVGADADGNFTVAWVGEGSVPTGIYARHYFATGAPTGADFLVAPESSGLRFPQVAMNDGRFVVAWEDSAALYARIGFPPTPREGPSVVPDSRAPRIVPPRP
ncbi:MAG: hypothetical protein ABI968_08395 [Acidobacteriota bacterium]